MVRIPTAEDARDCFNLNIISDWTDVKQEGNARLQSSKTWGSPLCSSAVKLFQFSNESDSNMTISYHLKIYIYNYFARIIIRSIFLLFSMGHLIS